MGFIDTLAKSASGALASTPAGLVAGGVGQLFSAMSAARDWKYKQKEMALQQQYNEKNMRLQFDYAREAFDMENEYNDPRNAVARWRAAGIAPQAVYGSSPGGAGVAGSLSTPDSSNPSGSGVDGSAQYAPVMTLGDIQRIQNETKVANSQADLNAAKAEEARANAVGQQNTNSIFDLFKRAQELANDNAELERRIKAIEEKYAEANATKDLEIKDSILRETDARINKLMADKTYQEQATEKLKSDMDLIKAQIATESSKQHNLDADADYKRSLTNTENSLRAHRVKLTKEQVNSVLRDVAGKDLSNLRAADDLARWLAGADRASSLWEVVDKAVESLVDTHEDLNRQAIYVSLQKQLQKYVYNPD